MTRDTDFLLVSTCKMCGEGFFDEKLELNKSPLANELFNSSKSAIAADEFSLTLRMCSQCRHIQLETIVSGERLFKNYIYQSGTSKSFHVHFEALAETLQKVLPNKANVLEIGSNDGTLLKYLEGVGFKAYGIEPSRHLVELCKIAQLNVVEGFLDRPTTELMKNKFGLMECIIGNNVFAHIDDLSGAVGQVCELLNDDGLFVFEVAYAFRMFEKNLFDTIYHEHMSYHTVTALVPFLQARGFYNIDIHEISTHGGSIRVFARYNSNPRVNFISPRTKELLSWEVAAQLDNPSILTIMKKKIEVVKEKVHEVLSSFEPNTIYFGYAAPAKVVTFLSEMNLERFNLVGIVDDNVDKQGKFLPRSGIGITSLSNLLSKLPAKDARIVCLIFAWNLGDELRLRLQEVMPTGSSVVTFSPTISRVDF